MNLFTKQKQTHRLKEGNYASWQRGGRMEEGIVREFGIMVYIKKKVLDLKWISSKVLLYSTGISAQCYKAAWIGGNLWENGCMCMYGRVAQLRV